MCNGGCSALTYMGPPQDAEQHTKDRWVSATFGMVPVHGHARTKQLLRVFRYSLCSQGLSLGNESSNTRPEICSVRRLCCTLTLKGPLLCGSSDAEPGLPPPWKIFRHVPHRKGLAQGVDVLVLHKVCAAAEGLAIHTAPKGPLPCVHPGVRLYVCLSEV